MRNLRGIAKHYRLSPLVSIVRTDTCLALTYQAGVGSNFLAPAFSYSAYFLSTVFTHS